MSRVQHNCDGFDTSLYVLVLPVRRLDDLADDGAERRADLHLGAGVKGDVPGRPEVVDLLLRVGLGQGGQGQGGERQAKARSSRRHGVQSCTTTTDGG